MKKEFTQAPHGTGVTKSKKVLALTEEEYEKFYSGKKFSEVMESVGTDTYDGQPLDENVIYTLTAMSNLKILIIKSNRRTHRRALKMMNACHQNGMTTPAILTDARQAHEWGLTLVDPVSLEEATAEDVEGAYVLMEGHGRLHGWLIDVSITQKLNNGYAPYVFRFTYNRYDSPEAFGKAYTSTNADMTRTTHSDRLNIAADRSKNPLVIEHSRKCREDKVIAKASYFWTYGRELTSSEVTKITYGEPDAPTFDPSIIEALQTVYDSFKKTFGDEGAKKIYRGVSAAQWAAQQLKDAADKETMALAIDEKLGNLAKDIYTAIITASTNRRKGKTRDQIIKQNLDKMMK